MPPRREGELATKTAVQQVYYHGGWHHLLDERQVARHQALHRDAYTLFGQPPHLEEPVLELLQLLLEMTYDALCHQPNLPVT